MSLSAVVSLVTGTTSNSLVYVVMIYVSNVSSPHASSLPQKIYLQRRMSDGLSLATATKKKNKISFDFRKLCHMGMPVNSSSTP